MSSVRAPDYDRGIEEPEMPFDFDRYRRPEVYGRITSQRGVQLP